MKTEDLESGKSMIQEEAIEKLYKNTWHDIPKAQVDIKGPNG